MSTNLTSIFSKVLSPLQNTQVSSVQTSSSRSNNPFANPFLSRSSELYGKNAPVKGGYFAGYYNGKPNIVGTKLFIEI